MIQLKTPHGLSVNVPETDAEDLSSKFSLTDLEQAENYYHQQGYVIFETVISEELCDEACNIWNSDIVNSNKFIYRQTTGKAEKNITNKNKWVMNPILNLQSLDPRYFSSIRKFSVNNILTNNNLKKIFEKLLQGKAKIVQSMFFQGNSETWEHQDSYYLDSENIGSMAAAWIALEDIDANAGRFFVVPESHKIDLGKQNVENNIADNHDVYINSVVKEVQTRGLQIRAPKLNKGDVLIWNSWTIHGSLKQSIDSTNSRSSITCHAINQEDKFLQLHSMLHDLTCDNVNDVMIWRPKDLSKPINRLIFFIESYFPRFSYTLKNIAVRYRVSKSNI